MSNAVINAPTSFVLVEDVVLLLCSVVLAGTFLWLAACTVVCVLDQTRGTRPPAGPLRPRLVRMVVAVALGSTVAATGMSTATEAPRRRDGMPQLLDGLPVPDRAYGGVRLHVVRPGESLWSVAEEGWPRLHRLNRDRMGPDPDLVHPGTRLRIPPALPPALPRPTSGAPR